VDRALGYLKDSHSNNNNNNKSNKISSNMMDQFLIWKIVGARGTMYLIVEGYHHIILPGFALTPPSVAQLEAKYNIFNRSFTLNITTNTWLVIKCSVKIVSFDFELKKNSYPTTALLSDYRTFCESRPLATYFLVWELRCLLECDRPTSLLLLLGGELLAER